MPAHVITLSTMAKVTQLAGVAVGKVGAIVYSIRGGEQIARQYQPNVSNPNTEAQVASRAKLKLLSQLSASLADVIAIPRRGSVTARNIFTKINYAITTFANEAAQVATADIQLTDSSRGLSGIVVERTAAAINVQLESAASVDKVVYVCVKRLDSGQIMPVASRVATAGNDDLFAATLPLVEGDITVHAYGIVEKSAAARASFGNYSLMSASDIAKVVAGRTLSAADVAFTETRGVALADGDSEGTAGGRKSVSVSYANSSTSIMGSFTGNRSYAPGSQVTLVATASAGYAFRGWYSDAAHQTRVSQDASYTFTMPDENVQLYAFFEESGGLDEG